MIILFKKGRCWGIMKKYFQLLLLLIGTSLLFQMPHIAKADPYLVKDKNITLPDSMFKTVQDEKKIFVDLVSEDRQLRGLTEEVQYFYSVPVQGVKRGSELQFNVKYSQLLLSSSTITILVDDRPVKSVSIDTDKTEMKINVPLEEKMMSPGFHQVTVAFQGHLTKNICENEQNPANWLTILATSSLVLEPKELLNKDDVLKTYPYPFIQPEKDHASQATIVIPNKPTTNVLTSALNLANYLERELDDDNIPIIQEKDIKKIDSHLIAIGTPNQWDGLIDNLFNSINMKVEKDSIIIRNYFLQSSSTEKQMMFVTADDDQRIVDNIHVLTEPSLIEQLSGSELVIEKPPVVEPIKPKENHSFEDLNIPSLKLSGKNKLSQTHFYKLPSYIDETKDAKLHLLFNFSETLLYTENHPLQNSEEAELVVYINDVPHSVSVNHLTKEKEGEFYEVTVPIEARFLNKEKYISLQFAGNGLQNDDICIPPSDDDWMYIHEDSLLEMSIDKPGQGHSFNRWPAPFITNESSETIIVLPDSLEDERIKQLGLLVESFGSDRGLEGVELVFEKDIKEEKLKNQHVIVLGHIDEHPSLEKYKDQLLITTNQSNEWNVSDFNFLQETSSSVAWMQPSVWDETKTMAVFSTIDPDEKSFLGKSLSEYLLTNKVNSSIIVENKDGEIFTHTSEDDIESNPAFSQVDNVEGENNLPVGLLIGFFVVLLISIGLLITLFRRRKRKD